MSLVVQSLVSSTDRPVALRRRADLIATRHVYQGRRYWVVKDPVALKYFRFEEEEYAILEMLDGRTSLEQIQRRFEKRFAPQKIAHSELHQLVGMLHRSSLVVSELTGQGWQLYQRSRERRRQERWAAAANVLSLRFKGVDPDRLLGWLDRRIGWMFAPAALAACLAFALAALLLVACQFQTFQARLPTFHEFFAAENWVWLAVTLGATKVLHEFGHGLSCKHFGGECHEMGVMLLVGTPCLYCNVSDSWMLPGKWQRAFIGAAGMVVELLLAAVATFLWWFSQPGLLNALCLNVMFVCSVSTVVFNANPLMRLDGYYILSDMLEIPNLQQKARQLLRRKLANWMFGLQETPDPFLPSRRQSLFALYALCSTGYRWFVTISILLFLNRMFEPYGLKVLGQMLAVVSLAGMTLVPLWQLAKFLAVPGRFDQMNKKRSLASAAAVGLLVVVLFAAPFPHRVACSLLVQPRDAAAVYVDVPGSVRQIHVRPGQQVEAGQVLVTLENLDLQLVLLRLEGERGQRGAKLESLRQRTLGGDEAAGLEIGALEESIAALDQQIAQRRQDLERLVIRAPRRGVLFAAPSTPAASKDAGLLPTWSGAALDARNQGAFFSSGLLLGRIGDPERFEAILAVAQEDVDFVERGRPVDVVLHELPGERFAGVIQQVAADDMKTTPLSLSSKSGGAVATRTDASGRERPIGATYQASVALDDPSGVLAAGVTGRAKIYASPRTAAYRVWRFVCQTFRFTMSL